MNKILIVCIAIMQLCFFSQAADNSLSQQEKDDGWKLLFDGSSLTNWQADKWNPGGFSVSDGSIKCTGKPSMIYYSGAGKDFINFHFSTHVMTKKGSNSGIFFHTKYQDRGWPVGHEAQVNCTQHDPVKSGSIYVVSKYKEKAHKDNEWFHYEIIVKGKMITTKINGKTISSYTEKESKGKRKLSSGTFGLQAHDPGSTAFYKNIKVKVLSDEMSRAELVASRGGTWYDKMDFGPSLATSIAIGKQDILKSLAVRLGPTESHTMIYDTEMMSFNVAKKGFIKIEGTPWNGSHGGYPKISGSDITSPLGPGWAKGGSFKDPRQGKFGPLPKGWVKYQGHYRNGKELVLEYTVGNTQVFEQPSLEIIDGVTSYSRTLNIPQVPTAMTMMVLKKATSAEIFGEKNTSKKADKKPQPTFNDGLNVITQRSNDDWSTLAMGPPSKTDTAQSKIVRFTKSKKLAKPHSSAGAKDDTLPRLTNGVLPRNQDDTQNNIWFDGNNYEFTLDLEKATDIARINIYSWHKSNRAPQKYTLNGSVDGKKWSQIAKVDTNSLGEGAKHAVSLFKGKGTLGKFQFLRWSVPNKGEGTFFSEIDVFDTSHNLPPVKHVNTIQKNERSVIAVIGAGAQLRRTAEGDIVADIAAGQKDLQLKILMTISGDLNKAIAKWPTASKLDKLTQGGKIQWPDTFPVKGALSKSKGPYSTEDIPLPPDSNPWSSKIRFSGFDFFADGKRAAICTWNGDVWVVSGIDKDLQNLSWKRYAAGLYETLGLKIVDDVIYVTGKDQVTRLHDLNQDGEADFYECFNNDIMITKNFHEFTFDLQTDKAGNFYFAKAAPVKRGGRGFEETHAHHGVVFKISKDGSKSEIYGSGLRAPGGMGVGPNGEITTGENEGTYVPACKINWVKKDSFNGVIHPGNGRTEEQGYNPPLCWLPMSVDNSGGGQLWVNNDSWGPFNGDLLHLSYGKSKVYKVMPQEVDGTMQGGVFELPIKLSSSAMRGRFNPIDKQLYVSGFRGWQTNAAKQSSLQRIRYNGTKVVTPKSMRVTQKGIYLSFTEKLDKELAEDPSSYNIQWWNYLWSSNYGSAHYSIKEPKKAIGKKGGEAIKVKSAKLQPGGKTVFIEIPDLRPVMQMQISLDLETVDGDVIITKIYNTIHKLAEK